MRPGPRRRARATATALLLAALLAAAASGWAQDRALAGSASAPRGTVRVEPGQRQVTVIIRVHNAGDELTLAGVEGQSTAAPPWVRDIRVERASAGAVPPGESRDLVVRFDVAGDAPVGQRATLALELRADGGWTVSPRRVALAIEVGPASGSPSSVPLVPEPEAPPSPPTPGAVVLRLSEIEPGRNPWVPGDPNQYTLQHQAGAPGFAGRQLFGNGNGTDTVSVRLATVPLEIVGGQPFEIVAETRRRISYREDHVCVDPARRGGERRSPAYLVAMVVPRDQVMTAAALTGAESEGSEDLQSYCDQSPTAERPSPRQRALEVDGRTTLTLRFEPIGTERAGARLRYRYRVRPASPATVRALPTTELVIEGDPAQPDRFWQLLVMVGSGSPRGLHLVYRAAGGPVIAALPPYAHPPELLAPPRGGTVTQAPPRQLGEAGGSGSSGGPGGAGGPFDPDEARVAGLIRDWLAHAEPPENATDGAELRYDEWGDKIGRGAGVVATRRGPPDGVGGRSSARFVWEERRGQDSVDHCTLEQYVTRRLAGQGIADCAGRHQAVLKDLARATRQAAEAYARQFRLQARLLPGAAARHADHEGTVERQDPAPGTRVPRGAVLHLYLHEPVRMPPLVGRSLGEATALLVGRGLSAPRVVGADPARAGDGAVIERQDPPVGQPVARSQAITVAVRAREVSPPAVPPVVLPDLAGRRVDEARQALAALGLPPPRLRGGAPTADPAQANRIERHEPPAGPVARDRVVTLWVAPPANPPQEPPPGLGASVVLPDLAGRRVDEARQALAALGLPPPRLRGGAPTADPARANRIERHEPPAGPVARDRVVTLLVRPLQAPPSRSGSGSQEPAPAEPRTWTTFDCRHPALAPPWDPPTTRAPVRADQNDPRVLHVECGSLKRQAVPLFVSIWISWAEPGARAWGCGSRDLHRLGEPRAIPPPAPGRYARSAETHVFSQHRRIRVVVRQDVYGQSPAALTTDGFLPEQETRRLALDYLARMEPYADVCPGITPPPAPGGVAPPPGSPQALGLPVRLYLWESIHSNQPAYEHGGRYWFYSQEQWTGFLVRRGRDFERYQVQDPGRAVRRYTYQGTERRHDGKDEWYGQWQDVPAGASDRFRIVWP